MDEEPIETDDPERAFSWFIGSPLHDNSGDVFHDAEEPLQDHPGDLVFRTGSDMAEASELFVGEAFFEALEMNDNKTYEYREAATSPLASLFGNAPNMDSTTPSKQKRARESLETMEESSRLPRHVWSSANGDESSKRENDESKFGEANEIHDGYAETQEELPEHLKTDFLTRLDESLSNGVSAVELEKGQFDVYGVAEIMEEDGEMVKAALNDMATEIDKLKAKYGAAYLMAENTNPGYVKDPKLRIAFLRASNFNGKDGALRMLQFCEAKLELWGPDRIAECITLSNMGPGPRGALENGHMQILPSKDLGGRRVIFNNVNNLGGFEDPMDQWRLIWYLTRVVSEDEEVQRRGIVYVHFQVGPQLGASPHKKVLWKGLTMSRKISTTKCTAIHLCFDRSKMSVVGLFRLASAQLTNRIRVHEGFVNEILDKLATFGIAREDIPVSEQGDMLVDKHREWIRKRQFFEESRIASNTNDLGRKMCWSDWEDSTLLISPSITDVLITHGEQARLHPGNLRFSVLLENYLTFYAEAPPATRGHIVVTVAGVVKSYGGRFLIPIEGGLWEVADSSLAQSMIAEAFQTTTSGSVQQLILAASAKADLDRTRIERVEGSLVDSQTSRSDDGNDNYHDEESTSCQSSIDHSHPSTSSTCEANKNFDSLDDADYDGDDGYAEPQTELPPYLRNDFLRKFDSITDQLGALHLDDNQVDGYDGGTDDTDPNVAADEDPEMVEASLKVMDMEVEGRKTQYCVAYVLAENKNPGFVKDRQLRMWCLRHCNFNGKDAALQLFDFLEAKLDLFGPDRLAERITISNMGAGTRGALENGHMQLLPSKDQQGRRVIFNNNNHLGGYEDGDDTVRLGWYLCSVAMEDEDVQRRGIVFVQFKVGPQLGSVKPQKKTLWKALMTTRSLPCRLGLHLVFDRTIMPLIWLIRFTASYSLRGLQVHEGSFKENLDSLFACGIVREEIPVTEDGEMLLDNHKSWIRHRKLAESRSAVNLNDDGLRSENASETKAACFQPVDEMYETSACAKVDRNTSNLEVRTYSNVDVLMGRGRHVQTHVGNNKLRLILEANLAAYSKGPRAGKKQVALAVIDEVKKSGGRFLRPTGGGGWEVADSDSVLKKVIHDFRTIRGILKRQQRVDDESPEKETKSNR